MLQVGSAEQPEAPRRQVWTLSWPKEWRQAGMSAAKWVLQLLPAVVAAVAPTPVLAAGGIVNGRGLAAALATRSPTEPRRHPGQ